MRSREPTSHQGWGWEEFTDAVVRSLSRNLKGLVFLLWGSYAQRKGKLINRVSLQNQIAKMVSMFYNFYNSIYNLQFKFLGASLISYKWPVCNSNAGYQIVEESKGGFLIVYKPLLLKNKCLPLNYVWMNRWQWLSNVREREVWSLCCAPSAPHPAAVCVYTGFYTNHHLLGGNELPHILRKPPHATAPL